MQTILQEALCAIIPVGYEEAWAAGGVEAEDIRTEGTFPTVAIEASTAEDHL